MYPGDRYVDYVGVTVFNWGAPSNRYERRTRPRSRWRSMLEATRPGVEDLMRFSDRPIIIAELGSTTNAPPGKSKAAWIRAGYPAVYRAFRRVRAIVYFNLDMRAPPNRHENWSLAAPGGEPLDAYRALLTEGRFQGRFT
jgi:beta-mannanase